MTERLLNRVERHWSGNHTDSPLLLCLNHRCAVRNNVCEDDGASCGVAHVSVGTLGLHRA